jgi:ABC-type nickel/cobalt efflux system permease component RcnA
MNDFSILLFATPAVGILGLGLVLGLKHATEADHLAAVSTIVSGHKGLWSSALVGGLWGLGHTFSLFIAGLFVLLLDFQISQTASQWLEFGVGVMLTLLGLNVLRRIVKGGHLHFHPHEHGGHAHAHPHVHDVEKADHAATHHGFDLNSRALLIGMVHGLAGSAALMLLVIPTIQSRAIGMLYIVIFGIGSVGGMMMMSFLVGLPFHFSASRFSRFNHLLQFCSGILSIILGLGIIYDKGFAAG